MEAGGTATVTPSARADGLLLPGKAREGFRDGEDSSDDESGLESEASELDPWDLPELHDNSPEWSCK